MILGSALVVFVVIFIMSTISKKRDESADNRYLNNSGYQSAKECIVKALGKEKAKAIKERKEQATAEEQKNH